MFRTTAGKRTRRSRGQSTKILHGLAVIVLLLMIASAMFYDDANRSAKERQQEIFELFGVNTPNTTTEAPGIVAWLDRQVQTTTGAWAELESPGFDIPSDLAALDELIARATESHRDSLRSPAAGRSGAEVTFEPYAGRPRSGLVFRQRRCVTLGSPAGSGRPELMVMTHRRENVAAAEEFAAWIAPFLATAGGELGNLFEVSSPITSADHAGVIQGFTVVRLYAISEDGTFISLPEPVRRAPEAPPACGGSHPLAGELEAMGGRPMSPILTAPSFYFRFGLRDFYLDAGESFSLGRAWNSGFYIDAGGHGLVTTLVYPAADGEGRKAIVSVDIALEIEWERLARGDGNLLTEVIEIPIPIDGWRSWRPWQRAGEQLEKAWNAKREPANQAFLETLNRHRGVELPMHQIYHQPGDGDEDNSLAMVLVGQRPEDGTLHQNWLLIFVPSPRWTFSAGWIAVVLAVGLGLGYNRLRVAAEEDFSNLRNMLSTMNIPLVVAQPDDKVVYRNRAAARIGIPQGESIRKLIPDDSHDAGAHYMRMNAHFDAREPGDDEAGRHPRAYGVPLRLTDDEDNPRTRHVIIRSVSFTGPIEALKADRQDRLGIFFLLEPEPDLKLYESHGRETERKRLASILSHGADMPSHLLARRLSKLYRSGAAVDQFSTWLAGMIWRRLELAEWLLNRWDLADWLKDERNRAAQRWAPEDILDTTVVGAADVDRFLRSLEEVFELVRQDRKLRQALEWENGVLAAAATGPEVFHRKLFDWPAGQGVAAPIEGALEFFLEEALVNAVKHGLPGSVPTISVFQKGDRGLVFRIENEKDEQLRRRPETEDRRYGGVQLLRAMAALCRWQDLEFLTDDEGKYAVSWRARLVSLPGPETAAGAEA